MLGESYRSSRKEGKRRDDVQERLEGLEGEIQSIRSLLEGGPWVTGLGEIRERYVRTNNNMLLIADTHGRSEKLEHIMTTVIENGLRSGWLSMDGTREIMPILGEETTRAAQGRLKGIGDVDTSG